MKRLRRGIKAAAAWLPCFTALILSTEAVGENASNPLAAANNVDLRWQLTEGSSVDVHDVFVDGAYMLLPTLKLKYELHYNWSDRGNGYKGDFERLENYRNEF